ncbi:MAG: hypothetical protein GY749_02295 [Desulfobacteraceae bacterium]|nr:hypothetical protein [Desulfobacteraceae bacterium]MCP4349375.1 hypothetical protein [Desulfobacterales bacterium]
MRAQCLDEYMDKLSVNEVLQVIPAIDRIIFKLHGYGLSSKDIAVVVNSTEDAVNTKIFTVQRTLNEFVDYMNN